MAEPGREAVAGIVLHRPHLGRRPERVRDALGGALVIGREADADMTIVEDRVVGAVGLLDLVQRLRDQEALQAVARHEGERRLEEVQPTKRRKLVEHQQQAMPAVRRVQILGETPADLVEDQADQRLGAADVGGRHDKIERGRLLAPRRDRAMRQSQRRVTCATTGSR